MLVDSKLINLGEVFLREIIFYIVCVGESDIDKWKFCRYVWENLFWVEKDYKGENLVVSDIDENKLVVKIYKHERAKK